MPQLQWLIKTIGLGCWKFTYRKHSGQDWAGGRGPEHSFRDLPGLYAFMEENVVNGYEVDRQRAGVGLANSTGMPIHYALMITLVHGWEDGVGVGFIQRGISNSFVLQSADHYLIMEAKRPWYLPLHQSPFTIQQAVSSDLLSPVCPEESSLLTWTRACPYFLSF